MSTKIICAAVATLAVISSAAQAAGFSHIPTITVPRPVIAAPRPVVNNAPPSGLTRTNTIRHVGKFTEDTSVFTNANGKVVMAISSISSNPAPAATSLPPGTLAPTGLILNRTPSGAVSSATLVGGHAPGTSQPISGPLIVPGSGKAASLSSSGIGGSGQARNATNSQNSQNSQNSTNVQQAHQAHQGSNCTRFLHKSGFC